MSAKKKRSKFRDSSTLPMKRRRASMWNDPIVRILGAVIALIVIGGLGTFAMLIIYGTVPTTFVPKTAEEADLTQYRDTVKENPDPIAWTNLIMALGRAGKIDEAKVELGKLIDSGPDLEQNQAIGYCEAFILMMEKDYEGAMPILQQVRQDLADAYNKELADTTKEKNWAKSNGVPANWLRATINAFEIYQMQENYKDALEMLNEYLAQRPVDAAIIARRGRLELTMGNLDAAEKDFKEAARFLPDDPDVLQGLEDVKAAK